MTLSEIDDAGNEGVLRRSVDERLALEDRGNREQRRRRYLGMGRRDGDKQVVRCVVHSLNKIAVTLRVRGPKHDDAIETIRALEAADIGSEVVEVSLLIVPGNDIVRAGFLIRGDEIGIVDRRKGSTEERHVRSDLALEVIIENLGTGHGLVHRRPGDIPSTEDEVVGVDHGQDIGNGDVHVLGRGGIRADADGRCTEERTDVVRLLDARLGVPGNVMTIGQNGGAEGGPVVAAHSDHHETGHTDIRLGGGKKGRESDSPRLADLAFGLELIGLDGWGDDVLTVDDLDIRTTVDELGSDVVVRVGRVLGLHDDAVGTAKGRGMNRDDGLELGLGSVVPRRARESVRGHCKEDWIVGCRCEDGLNGWL